MFEDDIEINFDEILNCSPPASLKRQNSEPLQEESNKKQRSDSSEGVENKHNSWSSGESASSPSVNVLPGSVNSRNEVKVFHFKKNILKPTTSTPHKWKESPEDLSDQPCTSSSLKKNFFERNCSETCQESVERTGMKTPDYQNCEKYEDRVSCKKNNSFDGSSMKRKFPGPAGLLPERGVCVSRIEEFDKSAHSETKEEMCSQSSCLLFSDGPWSKMEADFLSQSPKQTFLPDKYNIQWIKSRCIAKKLINQKAPFLVAFVHNISSHSIQNPIVNLILKDKTGTIQGTILHNLYEEYSSDLTIGSVIVLKEIGVLNTGSNNEPYLTITPNNLITIYPRNQRAENIKQHLNNEKYKISIQNVTCDEILSNINKMKSLYKSEIESSNRCNKKFPSVYEGLAEPVNIHDNFRKAVRNININQQKVITLRPNLNNLKTRATIVNTETKNMNVEKNFVNSVKITQKNVDQFDEILDFFNTKEGIDEFFNEEPNFCSTQISSDSRGGKHSVSSNKSEQDVEMKSVDSESNSRQSVSTNKENCHIWENAFEGVDANSLFDDF